MEKKDDTEIIPDGEFLELVRAAKKKDPDAMLQLIQLYKEDIVKLSKFIHLPQEDAVSQIVLEFLECILRNEVSEANGNID
ncbi:helix-turn-helix domain-containing protein [Paenibacillus sp. FSL K6-2859]|uniref:helix-turn-helix domain-containing protein n=1 Tax=Paenibacillus sp. FSL K6-2859 TaxID=2921482 RepID=UPI0030F4CE40